MAAPLCRYCGKPIRKTTRTVYLRNRPLLSHENDQGFYRYLVVDRLPTNISECRKLTNQHVTSVNRNADMTAIAMFNEWDGKSYADEFFCTSSHAQKFGYAGARGGFFTTGPYRKALKQQSSTAAEAATPGEDR